jgi:hypothetical protein
MFLDNLEIAEATSSSYESRILEVLDPQAVGLIMFRSGVFSRSFSTCTCMIRSSIHIFRSLSGRHRKAEAVIHGDCDFGIQNGRRHSRSDTSFLGTKKTRPYCLYLCTERQRGLGLEVLRDWETIPSSSCRLELRELEWDVNIKIQVRTTVVHVVCRSMKKGIRKSYRPFNPHSH